METKKKRIIYITCVFLCTCTLMILAGVSLAFAHQGIKEATDTFQTMSRAANPSSGLGYIGAALATGMATIGAGIGVGIAGAAAIGAITENPQLLGRTLIYIGLAEGVAIYGLIISIMILGRL